MSKGSTISGTAGAAAAGDTVHALEWLEGVGERMTPYQAVVADDGSFSITGVPGGDYNVRLSWYRKGYFTNPLRVDGSKDYTVNLIAPDNAVDHPVTEAAVTVDNSATENPVIENPVESPAQAESVETTENPTTEHPVIVAAVETPTIAG